MTHTEEIPITKVAVSHVVGRGGEVIKKLKADTNTHIDIVNDSVVKVTGEEADCKKARALIEAIIAEQANPDYEGPEGKRLRAEADEIGARRDETKKKAQSAFDAGNRDEGHTLMQETSRLSAALAAKNKEAAAAILKNRNDGKGDNYLDLHGLRTEEALDATKQRLAELQEKPTGTHTDLELIPGAGHHSAPGKVALKPATAHLLTTMKLAFTEHTAGSFMVVVPGKGPEKAPDAEPESAVVPAPAVDETPAPAPAPLPETKAEAPTDKKPEEKKDKKSEGGCCIIM